MNKLLLYGPPGSGKTTLGFYIAKKLHKKIAYIKISDILSSKLGETMKNISEVFKTTKEEVIFIDEFDAFAKKRTDSNDVGELKRIVNSLIQTFDFYAENKIIIVSTNLIDTLDPAVLRRFGFQVNIDHLTSEEGYSFFKFLIKNEGEIKISLKAEDVIFFAAFFPLICLDTVDSIKLFFDKTVISGLLDKKTSLTVKDFTDTIFNEDYFRYVNIKQIKKKEGETLKLFCNYLEKNKYPKTKIAKLIGIHRNSYSTYAKEV